MAQWPNYTPTRYPELGLSQITRVLWRFVDITDRTAPNFPVNVGPHYASKAEALGDLSDYYRRCWGGE